MTDCGRVEIVIGTLVYRLNTIGGRTEFWILTAWTFSILSIFKPINPAYTNCSCIYRFCIINRPCRYIDSVKSILRLAITIDITIRFAMNASVLAITATWDSTPLNNLGGFWIFRTWSIIWFYNKVDRILL